MTVKKTDSTPKKSAKKSRKKPAKNAEPVGGKIIIHGKDNRRKRADSVDFDIVAAAGAGREIDPPAHIRMQARDMPFFNSVIDEFARAEWSDHQLEMAAMLARAMSDMEENQFMLRQEGEVLQITSKKKNVYNMGVNPRKQVVQMCAGTVLSLRRSLSLHARAHAGEGRDIGPRRAAAKEKEDKVTHAYGDDDDNLINRPARN